MTETTEAEIIAHILAGEKELFHQLIRPYERAVYLTLLSMLKNEADAEDAAQETILSAYRHLSSFRAEAKFSTWLIAIALNEGRARLRKGKAAQIESLDEQAEHDGGDYTPALLTDWREVPLAALENKEMQLALRSAVEALPPIYREVFTLRDLDELDVKQTATALGVSDSVVKVRLHRARILLQKALVPFLKNVAPKRKGIFGRFA